MFDKENIELDSITQLNTRKWTFFFSFKCCSSIHRKYSEESKMDVGTIFSLNRSISTGMNNGQCVCVCDLMQWWWYECCFFLQISEKNSIIYHRNYIKVSQSCYTAKRKKELFKSQSSSRSLNQMNRMLKSVKRFQHRITSISAHISVFFRFSSMSIVFIHSHQVEERKCFQLEHHKMWYIFLPLAKGNDGYSERTTTTTTTVSNEKKLMKKCEILSMITMQINCQRNIYDGEHSLLY